MGKTRSLFKKLRDTKEIFPAKMGKIKNRNGMDLTKSEDIRRGGVEKETATHSSILAWKSPWTEESGRLKFMGLKH